MGSASLALHARMPRMPAAHARPDAGLGAPAPRAVSAPCRPVGQPEAVSRWGEGQSRLQALAGFPEGLGGTETSGRSQAPGPGAAGASAHLSAHCRWVASSLFSRQEGCHPCPGLQASHRVRTHPQGSTGPEPPGRPSPLQSARSWSWGSRALLRPRRHGGHAGI